MQLLHLLNANPRHSKRKFKKNSKKFKSLNCYHTVQHNLSLLSWLLTWATISGLTFPHECNLKCSKCNLFFLLQWQQCNHRAYQLDSGNVLAEESDGCIPGAWQLASSWVSGEILIVFSLFNKALHEFLPPLAVLSQKLPKHPSLHYGRGKWADSRSPLMFHWLPGEDWN